jgi:hypothetical protein
MRPHHPARAAAVALAALSLCLLLDTRPAEAQRCNIVWTLTDGNLIALMNSMGFQTETLPPDSFGDPRVRWIHDDTDSVIFFFSGGRAIQSGGKAIQFYHVWTNQNVTVDDINRWNRDFRFSRAYLDDDGDPVLELDLNMAGGICEDRIKDFLKTCTMSFSRFKSEILK